MKKLFLVLVLGVSFFFTAIGADTYNSSFEVSKLQKDKISKENMQGMLTKMKKTSKEDKKVMKYSPKKSTVKCGAVDIPTH